MFNEEKISKVHAEIERLGVAVKAHNARIANDEYYAKSWYIVGSPETAAIKRASMDLSRALTDLRR